MAKDPNTVAQKWSRNLSGAGQSITAGVNAVTEAPGAKAARQSDVWLAKLTASADKWKRRVSGVSLGDWQGAMIHKGIPRISQGATQGIPKVAAFLSQWLPYEEAGKAALPARGSLGQNIQRAVQMMEYNAKFSRK